MLAPLWNAACMKSVVSLYLLSLLAESSSSIAVTAAASDGE
jgi:hypothetical protein